MTVKILHRSLFQRFFGLPATARPRNPQCWSFRNGKIVIDLKKAVELQDPGGAIRLEGGGLPRRVLVLRGEDGQLHAFHNRCAHMGHRRLDPVPGTPTVQCCSVGKSTYTYDGQKIHGPAPQPVTVYPVNIQRDEAIVSID
jgi:nitrite reductase/ring-hydroxylating ferredoxin subunit